MAFHLSHRLLSCGADGKKGEALALEQESRRSPGEISTVVSPLVKDLIPAWLEYYRNEVAPCTYADARVCLRHWLPHFGNFRPPNVSRGALNNYKDVRLQEVTNAKAITRGEEPEYTGKRTINKELSHLSSCLKWGAAIGHCVDLTFQIEGFPAKQTRARVPTVLTPTQISQMYEVIEPEYKLLFLFMADMGLRREEALSAMAEDVDEYHETMSVVGKGSKERILPGLRIVLWKS